jgi:hypothetical protein
VWAQLVQDHDWLDCVFGVSREHNKRSFHNSFERHILQVSYGLQRTKRRSMYYVPNRKIQMGLGGSRMR